MKLSTATSTLLFAVVVPSASAGILQDIVDFFSENIVPFFQNPPIMEGCANGLELLGLEGLDCACDGATAGLGVDVVALCTSPEICLPNDLIGCGSATVRAGFQADLQTATLAAAVESCLIFDANLPPLLDTFDVFSDLCIVAESSDNGIQLDECTITLNGSECAECTICDSGLGFSFDCSNVDLLNGLGLLLNNPTTVDGPVVDICTNLGFQAE